MKPLTLILTQFLALSAFAASGNFDFTQLPKCSDQKDFTLPESLQGYFQFQEPELKKYHVQIGSAGLERVDFISKNPTSYAEDDYCVLHKFKESRNKIKLKTFIKRNKWVLWTYIRQHMAFYTTLDKRTGELTLKAKDFTGTNVLVILPLVFWSTKIKGSLVRAD